jgi:hypothetical protein
MNKHELSYVLGFFVTGVNLIAVFCTGFVVCSEFAKSIRIRSKISLNFHFTLLVMSFAFSFGNGLALARFIQNWIIDEHMTSVYLALNGFADRIFMCIGSIMLLVLSLLRIPFFINSDE